jgi:uncharacterized membrane protein YfcA
VDPLVILFGLGVGLLVGTTGVGGGSLMTPLLILLIGIKPVVAIGTDLAYAAITKTVGGYRHFKLGSVDVKLCLWLCLGSIPGSVGGVILLEALHDAYGESIDAVILGLVSAAIFLTAAVVLARALQPPGKRNHERESAVLDRPRKLFAVALGLAVGVVIGVTSVGSGALIAVGLILVFQLTPRRVVGTDVFQAALLLWAASAAHLVQGNVDLGLMANLLVGSLPGIWIGAGLSSKIPVIALRITLGTVLVGAGIGLLTKAGLDVPPTVLVGVPLLVAAAATFTYRSRSRHARELAREPA